MVWSMRIAESGAPHGWSKDDGRQQEKDAGNLEPQNPAHAAKRAEETSDSLSNSLAGALRSLHRGTHRIARRRTACRRCAGRPNSLCCSRLSAGRHSLAGETSGDAKPDAESPADGLRSHPVYDGSSVQCPLASRKRRSLLGS